MTVEELISELGKYPPEMQVGVRMGDDEIEIEEVVLTDYFGAYRKVEIK